MTDEIKKHGGGRPTNYNLDIADEICKVIATTCSGLKTLCKQNPHWPDSRVIFEWLYKHEEFAQLYTRAKRSQAEVGFDERLEIADDSNDDYAENRKGNMQFNRENVERSKLRIFVRDTNAEKLKPKKYGKKIVTQITGKDNGAIEYKELSKDDRDARVTALLDAAGKRRAAASGSDGGEGK